MSSYTIGSSDVAAILGLSPWASPMQAWARLTGIVPRYDNTPDAAQRRGNLMEAALLAEHGRVNRVAVERGPGIDQPPLVAPAPHDWAHCRPDGTYTTDDGQLVYVVEVKTTRSFDEDEWGDDGTADVPPHYAAQVVWQMGVMVLRGAHVIGTDLVAYCPMNDEIRTYHVPHDGQRFAALLRRVGAWREKHVIGGEPPPVDGSEATTRILARVYPGGVEKKAVDPTDADIATARRLRDVKAEIAALEAEEGLLANTLRERIGAAEATEIKGVCRWTPTRGRVGLDAKALEAEMPDVYQRFAKMGAPFRTFTLTIKE